MRGILIILFVVSVWTNFAQSWKDLSWEEYKSRMEVVSKAYDGNEYTLELVYKTYKGRQLQTPFEVTPSYTQKSKSYDYSYLKGIVTIQNEKMKITIDSNNRMIAINNGVPRLSQEQMMDQYTQSKELIEKIREKEERNVKTIEIVYKEESPIEKVQLNLSRKDEISDLIIFYANPIEYEDDEGNLKSDHVVLQIEYKSFSKKHLYKELSLNDIIITNKEGMTLSEGFKDFELVDLRIKN